RSACSSPNPPTSNCNRSRAVMCPINCQDPDLPVSRSSAVATECLGNATHASAVERRLAVVARNTCRWMLSMNRRHAASRKPSLRQELLQLLERCRGHKLFRKRIEAESNDFRMPIQRGARQYPGDPRGPEEGADLAEYR